MKPVRFGIIGVGGMGGGHARSFAKFEGVELTAVADISVETAEKVAAETGAQGFGSAESLLDSGLVDAILIATPHFFHPPVAIYAASKGVHVLSEKPVAVTVSQADAMIEACEKAGVLLGVVFNQRTEGLKPMMKSLIDEGKLGELHRIALSAPWYRPQAYYDSGSWRGTWKGEGGGILMNQAPHHLDLFGWLMGQKPVSVQAICETRLHSIEVENTATAVIDFGEGKTGSFYSATSEIPLSERIEVFGDKGALKLENGELNYFELETPLSEHLKTAKGSFDAPKGAWTKIEISESQKEKPQGYRAIIEAFGRGVSQNDESQLVATGRDGLAALELANAILMAGFTRHEVDFPIQRADFDGMLEKLQNGAKGADLRA